jgi:TolA-binding protein
VLVLDSNGKERARLEGYLPTNEFRAWLELSLARVAFTNKQWAAAEGIYAQVVERYPDSQSASEALYWRAVSKYKATNDHTVLSEVAADFRRQYQQSIWALKSIPWRHE